MIKFNHNGFTMVEMLLSFAIFTVVAAFLPLLFQFMMNMNPIEKRNSMLEWEIFISQLSKEVQRSERIEVTGRELHLTINEDIITFQQYQNDVRRRVNFVGHEIVLQNVEHVQFIKDGKGVFIKVNDKFGGSYEAALYSFIALEE